MLIKTNSRNQSLEVSLVDSFIKQPWQLHGKLSDKTGLYD